MQDAARTLHGAAALALELLTERGDESPSEQLLAIAQQLHEVLLVSFEARSAGSTAGGPRALDARAPRPVGMQGWALARDAVAFGCRAPRVQQAGQNVKYDIVTRYRSTAASRHGTLR